MTTKLTVTHLCHTHCNCSLSLVVIMVKMMMKRKSNDQTFVYLYEDVETTLPIALIRTVKMMGRREGGDSISGPA